MPVFGPASWSGRLLARAVTSEGMLGVAGCAMALASGSFAFYTNLHGPLGGHEPSPYYTVFAQMSPRSPSVPTASAAALAAVIAVGDEIDPVVTGSIPQRGAAAQTSTTAPSAVDAVALNGRPILANMLLRQVDGDNALVEINDSLVVYKIGDMIPGAGRLQAMTRQGGRPALETSKGLIVESR